VESRERAAVGFANDVRRRVSWLLLGLHDMRHKWLVGWQLVFNVQRRVCSLLHKLRFAVQQLFNVRIAMQQLLDMFGGLRSQQFVQLMQQRRLRDFLRPVRRLCDVWFLMPIELRLRSVYERIGRGSGVILAGSPLQLRWRSC
jgi:hypothetical protein